MIIENNIDVILARQEMLLQTEQMSVNCVCIAGFVQNFNSHVLKNVFGHIYITANNSIFFLLTTACM